MTKPRRGKQRSHPITKVPSPAVGGGADVSGAPSNLPDAYLLASGIDVEVDQASGTAQSQADVPTCRHRSGMA